MGFLVPLCPLLVQRSPAGWFVKANTEVALSAMSTSILATSVLTELSCREIWLWFLGDADWIFEG